MRLCAIFLTTAFLGGAATDSSGDWPVYGHNPGGQRFSPLTAINRKNVGTLKVAWTYRSGDAYPPKNGRPTALEASPPAVIGDTVIVGSGVADNGATDQPSGEVRGFDAASGRLKWTWDPIPQEPAADGADTWKNDSAARTGAANAWSIIVTDPARNL